MSHFLALLPAKARPYAKSVVALVGVLLATAANVLPAAPDWVGIASSFLVALGVYAVPNGGAEDGME